MKRKKISDSKFDFDSKINPSSKQENSIKENKLINEIIDLKDAIKINWKILDEFIISSLNNTEDEKEKEDKKEIEDLLKTCKSLIENNISVGENIQKLKEGNQELTEISQQYQYKAQKEYEDEKNKYINLQTELTKKKSKLNDIENLLAKTRMKSFYKDAKNEVYIIEPTKKYLGIHQEILSTTDAINHLEDLGKEDNIKLNQLKLELNELENEYDNVKKQKIVPSSITPAPPGKGQGTPVVGKLTKFEPTSLNLNKP